MNNGLTIDSKGNKYWISNNLWHREGGPAIEYANGDKSYYFNGECHREDGPSIETMSGIKYWYFHGKKINVSCQEEFERFLRLKAFW